MTHHNEEEFIHAMMNALTIIIGNCEMLRLNPQSHPENRIAVILGTAQNMGRMMTERVLPNASETLPRNTPFRLV